MPRVIARLMADVGAKTNIVSIPYPVDTSCYFPGQRQVARQDLQVPDDSPLLLMLANLAPHKGQETAVRAVNLLKKRGIPVHCWLAGCERGGTDFYTARLKRLIAELEVGDRVRLLGHRDDTALLLRAADMLLLPSTCEGLPISIVEAQATKVPVLAAPTAGIPELIRDDESGYLIPADNAQAYADRIEQLVRHPERGRALAAAAYARVLRDNDPDLYCKRIWNLYQDLLGFDPGGCTTVAGRRASAAFKQP
jgi:glycosyltransferase involved in cell wall biosynthesis